ncbi:unnamed protein product [Macrosiphum euphorbiae]|uniref:Integrase catalytic domain-containing protein n=1 Tax=Macrosiphum euphorbiae TaxID=13131 RepID=A0AAV0XR47_9HEMI|nr:unnamed protein product [Macrosiphum euphorbiae]
MKEYFDMGHMREVTTEEELFKKGYYLPHHPVLKSLSLTTKTRVVFYGSARTTSGLALNDVLMRGPTVQEDIFSILVRFRKHQYVITTDIEKMFRQIMISPEDCHLQRILWRANPSEMLRTYNLLTITYGTTPASFMATQCLVTLAEEIEKENPKVAEVISRDFYMDDLMTGCDTVEECMQLQKHITVILESAKLPLRKWCSNSHLIIDNISENDKDPLFVLNLGDEDTVKSLGLCWQPSLDQFKFNIAIPLDRVTLTKRKLLSELNRVFDPLGFLGPVLIKGKIFLQHLWQKKIDWDAPLQADIQEKWRKYYSGLELLKELCIHRKCKFQSGDQLEVHGFCDASIEAYGACIYIRSLDHQGTWQSRLLCSKTRVAPLKSTTIPRLELSGALLLAQLAAKVADSWSIKCEAIHLWTDSMIVLGWLNSHSSRLKTFVANRVSQTLELTRAKQWHYIPTNENPADVLSRGTTAQELQQANGWWLGPHWLSKDTLSWSKEDDLEQIPEEALPELRTMQLSLVVVQHRNALLDKHSEWEKLTRATAWILKFIEFLRLKKCMIKSLKYLTASDLKKAERWLIRCAQKDEFEAEFKALSIGKELPKNSKIRGLSPFISTDNILVVGGRLHHSTLSNEQKHPIVLPFGHKVTRLIFIYYHEVLLHGGPQLLLSEVRLRFWPVKGRIIARSTTSRCVTCIRAKPKFKNPIMATLPSTRVRPARPFATTGVDFAGPLDVRSGIRRVTSIKTWIAVFVCLATRAIHLEPVVGLTSNAFFAALRRFMARRGKCSKMYSDNATNFVGVQRELATYLQSVDASVAKEGIDWHFNPPGAPHFGGIWESAVKSAKHHLTRVLKDAKLTLEELGTLLCQIEACLNSRPLTPLSSHPLDLEPITPAHFLIGGPLLLVPEADLSNENISTLRKWRYVQALMQTFWKRWSKEYLPQLQVRSRWLAQTEQVKIGDIVIIKEECTPPGKWKLGKILKTHPGSDGIVRVVTLKTSNGNELKRPVVKLSRLPVEEEDQNFKNHNFQRGDNVCAAADARAI